MAYIKMKDIDDFTYFRNRISFQMRALGIHSTKALSEKLRETGFFKRTDSMGNIHLLSCSIPCMVTCIKSDSTYNRQSDTNDCYNCYCFLFVFHIPFSSYLSFSFFNLSII